MKFIPKNIKKFQEGGAMAPEESEQPAPEQGGQDPLMMLAEAAALALQSQDCNMMALVCLGLIQLIQQMSQQQAPQGEPVFRKGGVLLRRIRK